MSFGDGWVFITPVFVLIYAVSVYVRAKKAKKRDEEAFQRQREIMIFHYSICFALAVAHGGFQGDYTMIMIDDFIVTGEYLAESTLEELAKRNKEIIEQWQEVSVTW